MTRLLALVVALVAAPVRADEGADHWAWKKPTRPTVPAGAPNPIDAFIRAKQKAAGITPAPPATREQLIRRATFSLTGLPPTPEETAAFVADTSPQAWERVVDRLLASPRYGERWARHWLDLARYADTNGYEFDEPRPDAWRYRDYVIRSLNADRPYDRFITEHLAGDEAYPGDADALIATGFNLLGPDMTDASDQAQRRLNTLNDMTDTAGLVFLGLTITCARCHDTSSSRSRRRTTSASRRSSRPPPSAATCPSARGTKPPSTSTKHSRSRRATRSRRSRRSRAASCTRRSWRDFRRKRRPPTARRPRSAPAGSKSRSRKPNAC
jgi:hypothetical protein